MGRALRVVIPYQVRSYQTTWTWPAKWPAKNSLVVIPYQVRSYQTQLVATIIKLRSQVVIPYQVRSYQTGKSRNPSKREREGRNPLSSQVISNILYLTFLRRSTGFCRNPLSSQVISNLCFAPKPPRHGWKVVIPYQVRSYQTCDGTGVPSPVRAFPS